MRHRVQAGPNELAIFTRILKSEASGRAAAAAAAGGKENGAAPRSLRPLAAAPKAADLAGPLKSLLVTAPKDYRTKAAGYFCPVSSQTDC